MAITISNNDSCNLISRAGNFDDIEQSTASGVTYHRHCQATILAACGTSAENGETWTAISSLSEQLSFLGNNWIDLFKNNSNITQDFSSILRLINSVSENVNNMLTSIVRTINITDQYGNMIQGSPYIPDSNGVINQKLGRHINLSIDGQTVSFDTIAGDEFDYSSEITEVEFPRHALSFTSGGVTLGTVNVIMDSDKTIDIPSDYLPLDGGTVTGDTTFNAKVTLKDSPSTNATGHEVVDAAWVKNKYSEIFDMIYPIGSVYISIGSTPPTYGNWVQLATGRTLWNVEGTDEKLGNQIEAGLPNIEGSFNLAEYDVSEKMPIDVSGAFNCTSNYDQSNEESQIQMNDGELWKPRHIDLSASRSSSIYGNSETVQPPSIGVTMWKRTS